MTHVEVFHFCFNLLHFFFDISYFVFTFASDYTNRQKTIDMLAFNKMDSFYIKIVSIWVLCENNLDKSGVCYRFSR